MVRRDVHAFRRRECHGGTQGAPAACERNIRRLEHHTEIVAGDLIMNTPLLSVTNANAGPDRRESSSRVVRGHPTLNCGGNPVTAFTPPSNHRKRTHLTTFPPSQGNQEESGKDRDLNGTLISYVHVHLAILVAISELLPPLFPAVNPTLRHRCPDQVRTQPERAHGILPTSLPPRAKRIPLSGCRISPTT